jgi:hypothetical protein
VSLVAALVLSCSVAHPDCPQGQFCNAEYREGTDECPGEGDCEPLPKVPPLELWLPIPSGESIFCAKGDLMASGSHAVCSPAGRFAFDFATPAFSPPHLVLASADGVAWPFTGCPSADLDRAREDRCNFGWGNMVHVEHAPGLYTVYAHLASVLVTPGQKIVRGEPIGVEGNSGAAGSKHVHWGLAAGDAKQNGVAKSVPVLQLHVAGRVVSREGLSCSDWEHDGHVVEATRLVSETPLVQKAQSVYAFEAPPEPLAAGPVPRGPPRVGRSAFIALFAALLSGFLWWRRRR